MVFDKQYHKEWRERNRDAIREKNRRYYIAHRERLLENAKAYYRRTHVPRSEMPEKEKQRAREFERIMRAARREQIREYKRRYYREVIKPRREGTL